MHRESYIITASCAENIANEKLKEKKLLAIGTTTMRALESCPHSSDLPAVCSEAKDRSELLRSLQPGSHSTDIFIYPHHQFQMVDAILTNFHLPNSTLLLLVSAFCSSPNTKEKFTNFSDSLLGHAYSEAIKHNYRFFSFGDAMLII